MIAMASQITSLTIAYSILYPDADQRKPQSSTSLGICAGNSQVTGEFLAQMASNAKNVSTWWRHYDREQGLTYAKMCISMASENCIFSKQIVYNLKEDVSKHLIARLAVLHAPGHQAALGILIIKIRWSADGLFLIMVISFRCHFFIQIMHTDDACNERGHHWFS